MGDNNLKKSGIFIYKVADDLKEANNMVIDKYKTKVKKVISGINTTFKKNKKYGETDLLNGGK